MPQEIMDHKHFYNFDENGCDLYLYVMSQQGPQQGFICSMTVLFYFFPAKENILEFVGDERFFRSFHEHV